MDNIAHTLAGLALARAGLGQKSAGATAALVIASNLPDADLVARFFGTTSYLEHHRGVSHSIVAAPLVALALAALLRLYYRDGSMLWLWVASLTGLAGHIGMDLWTNYGTRALLPFDSTWYAWDLVFIIDPIVWGLLLASVVLWRRSPMRTQIASVGLGLLVTYVGIRAALHARAVDAALDRLAGKPITRVAALPSPLSPFRWKVLADAGSVVYSGELDLKRPLPPFEQRTKLPEDAVVTRVRETSEAAAIFLDFSRFAWLEVADTPEGRAVSWQDLRFEDVPGLAGEAGVTPLRRRRGFTARVVLGPDGRIRSETIRF
jgi:inner membrane protein